jgi:hypothetical protein
MKNWLTRHRDVTIPALVVVVAVLVLANLMKYKLLTATALASNKDSLSALSSAVSVITIIVGSVFSYYRFFRGRTFFCRAELKVNVTVIPTGTGVNLHAVALEVKNIGSLSIWDPIPVIRIDEYGPKGVTKHLIEAWSEAHSPRGTGPTLPVIDSGETASFWTTEEVAESAWAVFYTAFVHSQGEVWKQVAVVRNDKAGKTEDAGAC